MGGDLIVDLSLVMDELGAALEAIDGLRVFPYLADRVTPPAAVVAWPDVTYDVVLRRNGDQMTFPVYVMVARSDARSLRDTLAPYLAGSGDQSVKAALEGGTYTACDLARVRTARIEPVVIADTPYLAAVFDVEVTGTGGA